MWLGGEDAALAVGVKLLVQDLHEELGPVERPRGVRDGGVEHLRVGTSDMASLVTTSPSLTMITTLRPSSARLLRLLRSVSKLSMSWFKQPCKVNCNYTMQKCFVIIRNIKLYGGGCFLLLLLMSDRPTWRYRR